MTSPQAVPPDDADAPVLQAIDLRKHFPVRGFRSHKVVHAVDDVNLSLYRGKVVALVGESGSGKSTIARLLAQLMPVTGGQILLHGEDATAKNRKAFHRYVRRVQMIFQDPFGSLNPVHTVRYTLSRSVRIHQGKLRGQELEDALTALLFTVAICGVLGATAGAAWFAYQVVRANPVAAVATMATVVVMWGVAYAVIRRATR